MAETSGGKVTFEPQAKDVRCDQCGCWNRTFQVVEIASAKALGQDSSWFVCGTEGNNVLKVMNCKSNQRWEKRRGLTGFISLFKDFTFLIEIAEARRRHFQESNSLTSILKGISFLVVILLRLLKSKDRSKKTREG